MEVMTEYDERLMGDWNNDLVGLMVFVRVL